MDLLQTSELLTVASGVDGIRRTEDQMKIWAAALAHVDFADAKDALLAHLADPIHGTEFLKPAHITAQIAARRKTAALTPATVPMCDLHDEYPLDNLGGCFQCRRYPDDRALYETAGVKPVVLPIGDLAAQIGRQLVDEDRA